MYFRDDPPILCTEKILEVNTFALKCPFCGGMSYYQLQPTLRHKLDVFYKEDNDADNKSRHKEGCSP